MSRYALLQSSLAWLRMLLRHLNMVTKADIPAAIGYAADTAAHEETVLLGMPPASKRTKR